MPLNDHVNGVCSSVAVVRTWKAVLLQKRAFSESLCSAWHQLKQTCLPLFGWEESGRTEQREMQRGGRVWQVSLHLLSNGYIVMARFHPLSLSDTHTRFGARTSLTVVSLLNFYQSLCLLPVSSAPLLPSFSDKGERTSDWQSDWSSEHA